MKKLLLGLLLMTGFIAKAQVYNNEWIDYSKTYYKFKVGKTGLYRISQSVLSAAGLGSTSADNFQLWRNGKQIPIYTSVATGSLSASDYIEFWGEMNDGRPDKELYRDPSWQLNDKWSLETDTAAYFLTVNPDPTSNLRLQNAANNVSSTSLTPDSYFMYTAGKYFRDRLNPGYAVNVGQYLYSSSYDKGEGWSSSDIVTGFTDCTPTYGNNVFVFSNLNVYKGGPAPSPKFKIAISGNQINQRRYFAKINSDSVLGNVVDFFNYIVDSTVFSLNSLTGSLDTVTVFNYTTAFSTGCPVSDRMTVHKYEITYPRTFNFNGQLNFEFTIAASAVGNYLQITNFASGSSTPVLYDLTNGKRYVADLSGAPTLMFVLDPSLTSRSLVLVNEDATNVNTINSLEVRNFVNYTDASNQGDYLIISDPLLFAAADGTNPVDEYRKYRSSAPGGSYTAKIYLADQINDQFGFGIKKNPAAVRNFLRYARNHFSPSPKHVFLVGHGMTYVDQRVYESYPDVDKLNLIPTYGNPASDVLLSADPGSSKPTMSIGRLSAIYPSEVTTYLKKVKDFEQVQATQSPLIKDKAWMKNVVHIVGASDDALDSLLTDDLNRYRKIISDTLFGGNVITFNKTSTDAVSQLSGSGISQLFDQGISLITYFGHSSATTMEFNLDNPQNYNNYQKYPLFFGMGCNAGAFFSYNPTRFITKETISEKYVLAPDRGTIGFVASTHFGIVPYLDIWAERAYKQISYKNYGSSIGEILKATAADVFAYTTQEDFYARC
ncbi:MAG: putative type IX secretion system sortase PorU2, partial [Flavisolibacter sp.]